MGAHTAGSEGVHQSHPINKQGAMDEISERFSASNKIIWPDSPARTIIKCEGKTTQTYQI